MAAGAVLPITGGGRSGSQSMGTEQDAGMTESCLSQVLPIAVPVDDTLCIFEDALRLVQRHRHGGLGRIGLPWYFGRL